MDENLYKNFNLIEKLKYYNDKLSINWKHNTNEFILRSNIISEVFRNYSLNKTKIKLNDSFANQKLRLIKPLEYVNFYQLFMPFYFINANLFIMFKLRNYFGISKYFTLVVFNIFSLYICFFQIDKIIFEQYTSHPNPYAKFMREEYLKSELDISERSRKKIETINKSMINKYNF